LSRRCWWQARAGRPTEEVVLGDLAHEDQVVDGTVSRTDTESAGTFFLDVDDDVHPGWIERGLRSNIDLFEIFKPLQGLGAFPQGLGIEDTALGNLQFAAYDIVAGPGVALDRDPVDIDQFAFSILNTTSSRPPDADFLISGLTVAKAYPLSA